MTIAEYLAENSAYIDEASLAVLEEVDQETFDRMCAMVANFGYNGDPGIDCRVSITNGTVSDFDAARRESWAEKGTREETAAGISYFEVQTRKGEQRRNVAVMQWGDRVIALIA